MNNILDQIVLYFSVIYVILKPVALLVFIALLFKIISHLSFLKERDENKREIPIYKAGDGMEKNYEDIINRASVRDREPTIEELENMDV